MYHRIAEEGPAALERYRLSPAQFEAQLHILRTYGFYTITSAELDWYRRKNKPLQGRPVLITFDDAYADFASAAWPILYRNAMRAEVFVVTDKVGGASDWDADFGPPAPLMDWSAIVDLAAQGVAFGSHLATHRRADSLTSEALLAEAARSRRALEDRLGGEIISYAAPYGDLDERLIWTMDEAGYRVGYSTREGVASLDANPMALPRFEMYANMPLSEFVMKLGLS
jgi:peptidoglycan/xylan/chitin deacetylase (PgdA/CDA1 family)